MIPRILLQSALVSAAASAALAADFVVTNLNDDGPGSLRDAVNQANAADDADTIKFDFSSLPGGGQRVINLTSGQLVLNHNVMIMGPGPKDLVVQRSTDEGTPDFRLFNATFSGGIKEVTISGVTIRNGVGSPILGGGALAVSPGNRVRLHDTVVENNTTAAPQEGTGGGAIFNAGELTITGSVFSGNSVTMPLDRPAGGGAIYNFGKLSVDKTVFFGNTATDEDPMESAFHFGGAIFNDSAGTLNVTDSSFVGNRASVGGAVFNAAGGTASVNNNTITGNEVLIPGAGGGISNDGTIDQLNSNIISGNRDNFGMPTDLSNTPITGGTINSASGNILLDTEGHDLDPTTNQLGVVPNLAPLENNGGPTPSRRPDPADGPTKDRGDDSFGMRFDQRGLFRNLDGGTDVGAVETGNRVFLAASGDWSDPANWLAGNVPGEGEPAWIVGGRTADLTGSGPINVDSINVGVSGDVGSADGAVVGSDVSITDDSIDVGSAYGEQSPINSGNGTVTLTNATISTNNLLVGVSDSSGEGVYTTAHGEVTLTSNVGGTSTLSVNGNAGVGSAVALAPGSKADAHGALEFDGQSADFGALFAGEALSIEGGRTTSMSQVAITAGDNVTAGSLSAGTSFASGDSSSSIVDARVDITANDVFMVDGPANIGGAQISGAAAEQASADVANVWYSVTANQHTVAGGLRVGQVGASSFGMPSAELPTAHVGTVRADINVQTLNVLNNLEVASLFATGPSENSIDDVSVTITGSDTEVTGVVAVGTMFLSDGASGVTGNAMLDVQGGSFTVTNTPPGFPSLRVGTIDDGTPAGAVAQVLKLIALARFEGVKVDLIGAVQRAWTRLAGADPASSVQATLELVNSEMTVGGDVSLAEQDGVATIASTVAMLRLNPSLLEIGGELRMGEGAVLDFTVEGLTRPALGSPGEYGAIDAAGAILDGQLLVDFAFPAVAEGDMFELIRLTPGGLFTGDFDSFSAGGLPVGLGIQTLFSGDSFFVEVISAPSMLEGDTNGDGLVNIDDLNNVRNNFGTMGDPDGTLPGDAFPFDGQVNIDDLNAVRNNFGAMAALPAAVPEPASQLLLCFAAAAATCFCHRRRVTSRAVFCLADAKFIGEQMARRVS